MNLTFERESFVKNTKIELAAKTPTKQTKIKLKENEAQNTAVAKAYQEFNLSTCNFVSSHWLLHYLDATPDFSQHCPRTWCCCSE
jgi:hypothetical protein